MSELFTWSRRSVLAGLAASAAGAAVASVTSAATSAVVPTEACRAPSPPPPAPSLPAPESFTGPHQSGVVSEPPAVLRFLALDLVVGTRAALQSVLRRLSATAAAVMAASAAEARGAVTVTIGLGRSVFVTADGRDRLGLASHAPSALVDIPPFRRDRLELRRCGGDVGVQICAADEVAALATRAAIEEAVTPEAQTRWTQRGFTTAPSMQTPRNILGFKDGSANPRPGRDRDRVVWVTGGDRSWMTGGTYLVARRIRADLASWRALSTTAREHAIGRTRADGGPLSGGPEGAAIDLGARDAAGRLAIPADAHARRANVALTRGARVHRRGYSYDDSALAGPRVDQGLFFIAFQTDPRAGFIPIQRSLDEADALNGFTTHTGSALFAIPPGAGPGGYVGQTLLEA